MVHVLAVGACLSPLAVGTPIVVVIAVGWGVVFAFLRSSRGGGLGLVVQGGLVALTVGVCAAALHLVWKASAAVATSAAAERAAAETAARAGMRLRERERTDLLLHDLVLGALIVATRVGDRNRAAAAQLAGDALRTLDTGEAEVVGGIVVSCSTSRRGGSAWSCGPRSSVTCTRRAGPETPGTRSPVRPPKPW